MHGLETNGTEVAFALRGAPAWHNLANKTFGADETVTTSQMLDAAMLSNWNIQLHAVSEYAPESFRFSSDSYMVTRTNPFDGGTDVLATVGERYTVVQNESLFEFADHILDGGASWESAGSIKGGRRVFGSLVIPREIVLDPNGANDKTVTYLLVNTSHDGSTAVQASITPVRVVCQNTLNLALNKVKQTYKIRHTQTVGGKVAAAQSALGLTYTYMDAFGAEVTALFEQSITDQTFDSIVKAIYPQPEKDAKGAMTKWTNKIDLVQDLYHTSPTNANIKGTAWGALNALTERLDWFRNGRGDDSKENVAAAATGFDPVTNTEKNRILSVVKELSFA